MRNALFASVTLLHLACGEDGPGGPPAPARNHGDAISPSTVATAGTVASTPPLAPLAPLADHDWLEPVVTANGEAAKLSVPNGATTARPLMIGLHGAGDRAEWSCGEWRGVTDAYPFVLCPHGSPARTYWDAPRTVWRQLEDARAEVTRVFPDYVAGGPLVLAGFSAGTRMAVTLLEGGFVSPAALVLVEGAYDKVGDAGFPALLESRGVRRLLLVCTTRGSCPTAYRAALPGILRAGIDARLNLASTKGHGMYPEVTSSIRRDWPWLVSGLAGWGGFVPESATATSLATGG